MRKSTDLKLKDETYTFGQWETDLGLSMLTRLIKLVGEPLAKIIIGSAGAEEGKSGLDTDIGDAAFVADAIAGLALRLDEDMVKTFFRDAMEQAICNGQPIDYDNQFRGRIGLLMKVTFHQVRHQFSDFLEFAPVIRGRLRSQSQGTSPQASV